VDLISIRDLTKEDVEAYFKKTAEMEKNLASGKKPVSNIVVANLFFEPSTRTSLSFQTAAKRLGADSVVYNASTGSTQKGETLKDTIRIIDGYADLIVIRHPLEGSARLAADVAVHPVINAGDGGNQHPTQTLIDLYTILKCKGKIDGLAVQLVGDLKHARAMRSLLYGLAMFGADVTLVAPKGLEMEKSVIDEVRERFGAKVSERSSLDLKSCDVLYVCRVQKERFSDPYEAEKVQKEFSLHEEDLKDVKKDLIILHPLPKIDEIPESVDRSPHAKYFEQAKYGVPVRMAILYSIIKEAQK